MCVWGGMCVCVRWCVCVWEAGCSQKQARLRIKELCTNNVLVLKLDNSQVRALIIITS